MVCRISDFSQKIQVRKIHVGNGRFMWGAELSREQHQVYMLSCPRILSWYNPEIDLTKT
jgi:hypothetical protein